MSDGRVAPRPEAPRRSSWWGAARARLALRGCDHVGRDLVLDGVPYVHNMGVISLGDAVRVRSSPVVSHLVSGPEGRLVVGDRVRIGHGAAIAAHREVTIGEGAELGPFVMIMDTDFHEAGKHESAGGATPIHIGAGARLGSRVTVLRGSTIGPGAIVAAGSVVKGDVPAGARVSGVPARPRHAGEGVGPVSLDRVREVVARTLGLDALPDPASRPEDIAAWDSLGSLNVLLSLEDAFGVALRQEEMLGVRRVADLAEVVRAARRRSA